MQTPPPPSSPPPTPPPSGDPTFPVRLELDHVHEIVTPLGLGRFAPYQYERMTHSTRIRIFWRRVLIWLLILLPAAWISGAGLLWLYVKQGRGFEEVRYAHMVGLPFTLKDYRLAKAHYTLKQGLKAAEQQNWRDAFYLLRLGLVGVPEHREARLLVARIYLMAGRGDMARQVLIEGLEYHRDEQDYLREVLGLLFSQQADDEVISLMDELLPKLSSTSVAYRIAATSRAYAHFNRGRLNEAAAVLREAGLIGTPEGIFVLARIDWERGRRETALLTLRQLQERVPADDEIYRTLIYYLRELGRHDVARRVALLRSMVRGGDVQAWLDQIDSAFAMGDARAAEGIEAEFLRIFRSDGVALTRLAELAARDGRVEAADAALDAARRAGFSDHATLVLIGLDARLKAGRFAEVLERCEALRGEIRRLDGRSGDASPTAASWHSGRMAHFNAFKAVALLKLGRPMEAAPYYRALRDARMLPAGALTYLVNWLEEAGMPHEEALPILRRARELDPLHGATLVRLAEAELTNYDWEKLPDLVEPLLRLRRPPVEVLHRLRRVLESDRFTVLPGRDGALNHLNAWMTRNLSSVGI